jgi:outer membrane lipoprotein-sorting protein
MRRCLLRFLLLAGTGSAALCASAAISAPPAAPAASSTPPAASAASSAPPAAFAAAPKSAAAPRAESLPDARATALRLEKRLASLEDLEARLVQVRKSAMNPDGDRASGKLSFKSPSRILVEFREPSPLFLYLTKEKFILYDPGQKQAQRYTRGEEDSNGPLFLLDLEEGELLRRFDVKTLRRETNGTRLLFRTRPGSAGGPGTSGTGGALTGLPDAIEVVVDSETSLPREISWVEATGDTVSAHLDQFRVNRGIPASRFEFKAPRGVDVIDDLGATGR